jgi:cytochrome c
MLAVLALADPAPAQLRGHGGPVRTLAISPDGTSAVSGSFDSSAIRWSLTRNAAEQVLRFHESAVNAVAFLPDGRIVTGGEDGRIALWTAGAPAPAKTFEGHTAPIVGLAVAPDGKTLASASWDRTVRLWPLARFQAEWAPVSRPESAPTLRDGARSDAKPDSTFAERAPGGAPRVLEGHKDNVNGVAFSPDGRTLVSAGYDLTVRIWPLAGGSPTIVTLPTPLNSVEVARDGDIVAGGADGRVFFLSPAGELRGEVGTGGTPIIDVAISGDGALVAAAGIRGSVAIVERATRTLARTLVGPGLPVWSAVFFPDSRTLLTGGTDRMIRRWDAATGDHIGQVAMGGPEDPLAAYAGDPGAQVFRACVACHTLSPDEGNRAGPTLAGIFGRRIATLPGYNFSPALKNLDIVWTPETVAKLFEIGPMTYTPGTKMPEQKIGSAEDRAALVKFLEKVTNNHR